MSRLPAGNASVLAPSSTSEWLIETLDAEPVRMRSGDRLCLAHALKLELLAYKNFCQETLCTELWTNVDSLKIDLVKSRFRYQSYIKLYTFTSYYLNSY